MKIKGDFVLRQIAGSTVVVPIGESAMDFSGMLNLNETGVFLFKALQDGASKEDLLVKLTDEYDVPEDKAAKDIDVFINKLKDAGIIG